MNILYNVNIIEKHGGYLMKKIFSLLLCAIMILGLVGCGDNDMSSEKKQLIKQFEEGVEDYKTALEYFKKDDHENKGKYLDLAFEKFNDILNITNDGDLTVLDTGSENYKYYYEHYYSGKLTEIYSSNTDLYLADYYMSYEQLLEEWNKNIDNMNNIIKEYKETNNNEASK